MSYNHLQHIKLLQSLYNGIRDAFIEIEEHPMDIKKINDALVSVEAKIYIHKLDKLEMEKSTDEAVCDSTQKPEWMEELKTILDKSKTMNEHDTQQ